MIVYGFLTGQWTDETPTDDGVHGFAKMVASKGYVWEGDPLPILVPDGATASEITEIVRDVFAPRADDYFVH